MTCVESPLTAKAALLMALVRGEGYGAELVERVKTQTKGAVVLLQGSVYPALRALENDGLVKAWESEPIPERGGRTRRYYKLTAAGQRAALQQEAVIAGLLPSFSGGAK